MTIELGAKRVPSFRGKWPHVAPLDREILERFLDQREGDIEALYYNVYVGEGIIVETEVDRNLRIGFQKITQRRIDVVLKFYTDSMLYITEIRPHAEPGAVGNALVTWILFRNRDERPSRPAILTDELAQDMQETLEYFNIRLWEVGGRT